VSADTEALIQTVREALNSRKWVGQYRGEPGVPSALAALDSLAAELERLTILSSERAEERDEAVSNLNHARGLIDAAEAELERVKSELRQWETSIATEALCDELERVKAERDAYKQKVVDAQHSRRVLYESTQARLDKALAALREIEDTEWDGVDTGERIVGPDDIARTALADLGPIVLGRPWFAEIEGEAT